MSIDYPRETVEFQPITTTLGGRIGVMVTGLAVGNWQVYAKIVSSPETPVVNCGYFTVT